MTRPAALALGLAAALALGACSAVPGLGGGGGSSASCAGPYLDTQPPDARRPFGPPVAVRPGERVRFYGHWFTSTCNDTGQDDPLEPVLGVRLTVTWPDGSTADLGPASPGGADMGFAADVVVPGDVGAGRAVLTGADATYVFQVDDEQATTGASCVTPYLDASSTGSGTTATPLEVHPGARVRFYGHWYTRTCNDTGQHRRVQPLPAVRLRVTWPGGRSESLGRHVPKGADAGFQLKVDVPRNTEPGTAVLTDGTATYRFQVG